MPDLTPGQSRELLRWVEQQAKGRASITRRLTAYVTGLLRRTPRDGFYDPVVVGRVARQMAEQSRAAQNATASLTSQYVRRQLSVLEVAPQRRAPSLPVQLRGVGYTAADLALVDDPVDVVEGITPDAFDLPEPSASDDRLLQPVVDLDRLQAELDALVRPVANRDVWLRPAEQYRYAASTGLDLDQALEAAVARASSLAYSDTALAMREMVVRELEPISLDPDDADFAGGKPRVIGYRRVIHPEMSRGGTCGLCLAASDRRYKAAIHLPFHDDCHCEVMPITTRSDPGKLLNAEDLKALYKQAKGSDRDRLKRVRYQVGINGELGPVLRTAGQAVRGPEDIPAT